jgi:voltage-gated potassium channel
MSIYQRLLLTFCIFVAVVLIGGVGFKLMAGAQYSFLECAYNAFVFMSTVDRPFDGALEAASGVGYRIFSAFLIISGMGTILYGVSTITALIVEGELTDALRRRRMEKRIRKLCNHIIVCGVGETGYYIAEELYKTGVPFVVVESSKQHLERLKDMINLLYVEGDATADPVLKKAGIESAAGIILALHNDQENLFATITARQLNPRIKIVVKCVDPKADKKLTGAGANEVVSPSAIGGLRMVSVMVRPTVVTFLDKMLRDPAETTRIEEMTIAAGSELADKTLAETRLGNRASVLVLAARPPGEDQFIYRLTPETELAPGAVIVIMGEMANVKKARILAGMTEETGPDTDAQ